ncbi:MAG TPA: extracellular solute-binding protein [Geminicoccaceae bacterium]|nr:extracellular solute-binding protein [Geminicoccaceae bacterium]
MKTGISRIGAVSNLALLLAGGVVLGSGEALAQLKHEGVEATVMTFTGPQIAEPLQRRAPEFKELTGATINVVTVPFSDLYSKLLTDFATGTNSIDGTVFAPQWMVDFIEPGYLEDLTERVGADEALQWDDVAPFFRDFSATYNGRIYTIPLDGDFQMVYYRSDLLDEAGLEPPTTWEDYLEIARTFHGQDLNGDGIADYGSCIAKKRNAQSYWMVISVAGGFLQSQGTGQGAFFGTDDMSPLFNNEAFGKALDIYAETTQYGPPDEINLDVGDTRGLFTSGRCALSVDWGDIGTLAIDPATSKVQNKVGAVILPGSGQVLDRETGKLVDCDAERCPHATDGINHAPFAAFGGWSGAVNAASSDEVKAAVYDFFSYLSQPEQANEDVTIGITGFNPYRTSQFESLDLWRKAGMSEDAAKDYLGAIADSLNSPNMVLDLRIPQNQRYEQIVLDTAIHRMLAGEIDRDQAMADIETGWNEITEELGADEQLESYKATLGIRAD